MKKFLWVLCVSSFMGCAASRPPLKTVDHVDLERYMGPWYVIASIPIFVEKDAFNAVEVYRLDADGSIDTTFTFNKGSLEGPAKTYKSRAFVVDKGSNAAWKVQFVWPFRAEYLITHLDPDYSQVIVSRNKRDYVWVMARTPHLAPADVQKLLKEVEAQGYDPSKVRLVPHKN
jgi:apolipoprotein D and lipocalin family protein